MEEDDWDLYAVVRGCKSFNTTATGLSSDTINTNTQNFMSCLAKLTFDEEDAEPVICELQQACIPFMRGTTTMNKTRTNCLSGVDINVLENPYVSDFGGFNGRRQQPFLSLKPRIFQEQKQQQLRQYQIAGVTLFTTPSQPSRSRKRRSQQKRFVCHLPADKLSSDLWAWRKYGQKPIKGSPYPRNYYRCSSSKGCPARKQVERSTKDSKLFVVTFTGEHSHPRPTHRNSLAGSTRSRLTSAFLKPDSQSFLSPGSNKVRDSNTDPASSSPMPVSPTTPVANSPSEDETQSKDMETEAAEENHGFRDVDDGVDDDLLIPNLDAIANGIFTEFNNHDCAPLSEYKPFGSSLGSI